MAIRSDSYSSTAEVKAYTRHLLDGQTAFNSTTRPRLQELEKFIDRASGVLNVAIANAGFTPANVYQNSTAKLLCDDFVTNYAVRYVELTQRGTGYSEGEGSRTAAFLTKEANEFISMNSLGFVNLGVTQSVKKSSGLIFTGLTEQSQREDKDDTTKEQPFARRHQFNDRNISNANWHNGTGV